MKFIRKITLLAVISSGIVTAAAQSFVHPGILHGKEDLNRMKTGVAQKQEPIYSGYLKYIENPVSSYNYQILGPKETVGRNPNVGQHEYDSDANAAHQNAVMWCITGDRRYADKAIAIVNAWSYSLKSITGRDAVLMGGLGPFKMVNAAELLRYSQTGWAEKDIRQSEKCFREVIYPVIKDFAPFANGNWDAAAMKTAMAIGVFCNDRAIFENALRYYVDGWSNGRITHYIVNETGQIQESGRDQAHTQLGLAMLAECSQIAWNQGLNLYAYRDNLLLKGFEYVAKFNLGNDDVPFSEWLDRTGKYHHTDISQKARNNLRAVYEQVLNHYTNEMGIPTTYVKQAAERVRPEGSGNSGADHPGYGTLYFSQQPHDAVQAAQKVQPVAPGALIAKSESNGVALSWVESLGATSYLIKRSLGKNNPAVVVATTRVAHFTDRATRKGQLYTYTIAACNANGESADSPSTTISRGLPALLTQQTVGRTVLSGSVDFDGKTYRIEAPGMGLDSLSDSFHYLYKKDNGDAEVVFRYVPQLSSQFSSFGIVLRDGLAADAACVSLMVCPAKTQSIEEPYWHLALASRKSAGTAINRLAKSEMPDGVVTYGRLTGAFWLYLQKKGSQVTAWVSTDGQNWDNIGKTTFGFDRFNTGIAVASGIESKTTTVRLDSVTIK